MTNDNIHYPTYEMKRDEMIREAYRQQLINQSSGNPSRTRRKYFTRLAAVLAFLFPFHRI